MGRYPPRVAARYGHQWPHLTPPHATDRLADALPAAAQGHQVRGAQGAALPLGRLGRLNLLPRAEAPHRHHHGPLSRPVRRRLALRLLLQSLPRGDAEAYAHRQ
eukprot:scaffold7613_cov59-Phaeocystis_antarctica.AAC.3